LEQVILDLGEVLLLQSAAPEGPAAVAGVMLYRGRGWYPCLTALLSSRVPFSLVVITTDSDDPDLQHAERLGLRFAAGLNPGDPLLEAWRRCASGLPANDVVPYCPPRVAGARVDAEPQRLLKLLMLRGVTRREAEIALLAGQGLGNADIARNLFLSEATVKGTLRRAYRKLGVVRRAGLLALLR